MVFLREKNYKKFDCLKRITKSLTSNELSSILKNIFMIYIYILEVCESLSKDSIRGLI